MMRIPEKPIEHRSAIAAISVAFGILFGISRAHAQNAQAENLFDEGNKLMADGKLAQACTAFEASNRIERRAGTLIRLGECREQNHQFASAWSAYKDALNLATDPRKRKFATDKAAALESRLSFLTVAVSDSSRIRGLVVTRDGVSLDPMLWNRALPIDGGDYVIVAQAPGYKAWPKTVHVPVDGAKLRIDVPALAKAIVKSALPTSCHKIVDQSVVLGQKGWTGTDETTHLIESCAIAKTSSKLKISLHGNILFSTAGKSKIQTYLCTNRDLGSTGCPSGTGPNYFGQDTDGSAGLNLSLVVDSPPEGNVLIYLVLSFCGPGSCTLEKGASIDVVPNGDYEKSENRVGPGSGVHSTPPPSKAQRTCVFDFTTLSSSPPYPQHVLHTCSNLRSGSARIEANISIGYKNATGPWKATVRINGADLIFVQGEPSTAQDNVLGTINIPVPREGDFDVTLTIDATSDNANRKPWMHGKVLIVVTPPP